MARPPEQKGDRTAKQKKREECLEAETTQMGSSQDWSLCAELRTSQVQHGGRGVQYSAVLSTITYLRGSLLALLVLWLPPAARLGPGYFLGFPSQHEVKVWQRKPPPARLTCLLLGDQVFPYCIGSPSTPPWSTQRPRHANPSDKQWKFKETPWLESQQHQLCIFTLQKAGHRIGRVFPSPKAEFLFPYILWTWSNASGVKRVSLAQGGCTGKCFTGEQREYGSWNAEHQPNPCCAGWSQLSSQLRTTQDPASIRLPCLHSLSLSCCRLSSPQGSYPLGLPTTCAASLSHDSLSNHLEQGQPSQPQAPSSTGRCPPLLNPPCALRHTHIAKRL